MWLLNVVCILALQIGRVLAAYFLALRLLASVEQREAALYCVAPGVQTALLSQEDWGMT